MEGLLNKIYGHDPTFNFYANSVVTYNSYKIDLDFWLFYYFVLNEEKHN
jgi:hypothetical protein